MLRPTLMIGSRHTHTPESIMHNTTHPSPTPGERKTRRHTIALTRSQPPTVLLFPAAPAPSALAARN